MEAMNNETETANVGEMPAEPLPDEAPLTEAAVDEGNDGGQGDTPADEPAADDAGEPDDELQQLRGSQERLKQDIHKVRAAKRQLNEQVESLSVEVETHKARIKELEDENLDIRTQGLFTQHRIKESDKAFICKFADFGEREAMAKRLEGDVPKIRNPFNPGTPPMHQQHPAINPHGSDIPTASHKKKSGLIV